MCGFVLLPSTAARAPVAIIPALENIIEARPGIAIVVVVALPDVAERIERQLVRVPEVVAEHREVCTIRVHAQRATGIVRPGVRTYEVLAGFVGNIESGVTIVQIVSSIRSEDDGV